MKGKGWVEKRMGNLGTAEVPEPLYLLSSSQHPRELHVFPADIKWFREGSLPLLPLRPKFGLNVGTLERSTLLAVLTLKGDDIPPPPLGMKQLLCFRVLSTWV